MQEHDCWVQGTATLFAGTFKKGNESSAKHFDQVHAPGTVGLNVLQDVESTHRHQGIVVPLPDGVRRALLL